MLFQLQGKSYKWYCYTQKFSKVFEYGYVREISKFYEEILTNRLYWPEAQDKEDKI